MDEPDTSETRVEAANSRSPRRRHEEYETPETAAYATSVGDAVSRQAAALGAADAAHGRAEEHHDRANYPAAEAAETDAYTAERQAAAHSATAREAHELRAEAANAYSTTVNGPPKAAPSPSAQRQPGAAPQHMQQATRTSSPTPPRRPR